MKEVLTRDELEKELLRHWINHYQEGLATAASKDQELNLMEDLELCELKMRQMERRESLVEEKKAHKL